MCLYHFNYVYWFANKYIRPNEVYELAIMHIGLQLRICNFNYAYRFAVTSMQFQLCFSLQLGTGRCNYVCDFIHIHAISITRMRSNYALVVVITSAISITQMRFHYVCNFIRLRFHYVYDFIKSTIPLHLSLQHITTTCTAETRTPDS